MKNCTQCHILGEKISNDKCLECHKELKSRITAQKGYHVSSQVRGKNCSMCHNDHHGKTFKIIKFDPEKFDHSLTGYKLEGAHAKKACKDCHKAEFIKKQEIKKKKFSYLGLETECTACHIDYHQKTLSLNCENCHNNTAFKPASQFSHNKTKFPLNGKHLDVQCVKCHKLETLAGKKFQEFKGIKYDNCNSCHKDIHDNKFGPNCKQCHSETSFRSIKQTGGFDHNKTDYKLEGKHQSVDCKKCHKNKVTDPLSFKLCKDCHEDYHEKQFITDGLNSDCDKCHDVQGFANSGFSLEKHNEGQFKLSGAHIATPCFSCHKKTEKWSFRKIGINCADCHENIHEAKTEISQQKFSECKTCHDMAKWSDVNYDHSKTKFPLSGIHAHQNCRKCHFKESKNEKTDLNFSGLKTICTECHKDTHNKQFERLGATDCSRCHTFNDWKISVFDHNKTDFKLDGKHKNLACIKCHNVVQESSEKYVLYKIKKTKCEDCH
ncbi:MAG: cytochrome C [Bacteroidota bacterium]